MSPLFRRGRRDLLVVTLAEPALPVLRQVFTELRDVLEEPSGAVGDRLFPRAYLDPTEEKAEEAWQSAVHGDLAQARLDAIAELLADLDGAKTAKFGNVEIFLDAAGETRWLTVLNDARLTLGTALDLKSEDELELAPDDPRAHAAECYLFLTALQNELVEAVLAAVPEDGTGDDEPF